MLVNCSELPTAMEQAIPRHLSVIPDADERAAMAAASRRNAKTSDQTYVDDTQRKRAAVTPAIAAAIARHLDGPCAHIKAPRAAAAGLA